MAEKEDSDELLRRLSHETGYAIGAIQFTMNALNMTMEDSSADNKHVTAAALARCLLETVIDWFGDDAEGTLREWQLERSENLGKLVYGLIDSGLMKPGDGDAKSDFDGLYNLDVPQRDWRLQWPE